MVLQLGIAFTFIGVLALIGSLICIILPITCIVMAFKNTFARRRMDTNIQKINDSAEKYSMLVNKGT